MARCDCGAVTSRLKQAFDKQGNGQGWFCPSCKPGEFPAEPFLTPADRKIWTGLEALPHMYRQRSDGTWEAKDELLADTEALITAPRDWAEKEKIDKIIEEKRKSRRTDPMKQWEVEQAERAWTANHTNE